ncbi:ATP-binding protein [Kribbella sp. CA-293567]|uniref:ATP-binding protein n=1 Tax=Kribbella sp. CA-293567 TaxID=3002436 RepID=UPI0022DE36E5|nr:ATP-binding protein [Kribbella sp. CA-293567]WBQ07071.1 ATP-binding protein [Kribbella sp. CA-293567]
MAEISPLAIDYTDYLAERTRGFVGRDWVFGELADWLADPDGPRCFLLTGEPGAGKTSVSAQLARFSSGAAPAPMPSLGPGFLSAIHFCSFRDRRWINPQVFTESLTGQLAARHPAFARAVLRSVAPTVEIRQHVEQNWGRLVGAEIGTLIVTASTEDLFGRLVREPLEALGEPVVILVDALDESLGYTGEVTIAELLARTENLPAGIRFIVTSRPDRDVLRRFRAARELTLSPGRESPAGVPLQVLQDVQDYIVQESLDERLADDLPIGRFVATVRDRSEGNFLYVRQLLRMLGNLPTPITADSLTTLPAALDEVYLDLLHRLAGRTRTAWSQYGPVLGMLAVAQVPLTEARIAAFTSLPLGVVRTVLAEVRQLLETDEKLAATTRSYSLYHASFGEFLLDADRAEEYWLDGVDLHRTVALHFWNTYRHDWQQIPTYGLRNLAAHLFEGREHDRLQQLIDQDWIAVRHRRRSYSYDGLLDDVDLAWRAAEGVPGSEVRWALTVASVTSMARDISPDVLGALVATGVWSVAQGTMQARRAAAGEARCKAMALMAPHLPEPSRTELYDEALAEAVHISDPENRSRVLTWLLPRLPSGLRTGGLIRTVEAIEELSDQQRQPGGYGGHYGSGAGVRLIYTGTRTEALRQLSELLATEELAAEQVTAQLAQGSISPEAAARLTAGLPDQPPELSELSSTDALLTQVNADIRIDDDHLRRDVIEGLRRPSLMSEPPRVGAPARPVPRYSYGQFALEDQRLLDQLGPQTARSLVELLSGLPGPEAERTADRAAALVQRGGWLRYQEAGRAQEWIEQTLDQLRQLPHSDAIDRLTQAIAAQAISSAQQAVYGRGYDSWNTRHRIGLLIRLLPHLSEPALTTAAGSVLTLLVDEFADKLTVDQTATLAWHLPAHLLSRAEPVFTESPIPRFLPAELVPAALQVARRSKNREWLSACADRLSGADLLEVLAVARELGGQELQTELLGRRAPAFAQLDRVVLQEIWSATLRELSSLGRPAFLSRLRPLGPVIEALGGQHAVAETVQAIEDVGRWWP